MPGESHGGRSLVGYSPWGPKESDTTERLQFHFHLSIPRVMSKTLLPDKNQNKSLKNFCCFSNFPLPPSKNLASPQILGSFLQDRHSQVSLEAKKQSQINLSDLRHYQNSKPVLALTLPSGLDCAGLEACI